MEEKPREQADLPQPFIWFAPWAWDRKHQLTVVVYVFYVTLGLWGPAFLLWSWLAQQVQRGGISQ